jgi:hypothetical protein
MPREKMPPVREDEFSLEIDAAKGHYPFVRFQWGMDEKGRPRLIIVSNCNERGDVVGSNEGVAIVAFSPKKAKRIRDFLARTLDEIPD